MENQRGVESIQSEVKECSKKVQKLLDDIRLLQESVVFSAYVIFMLIVLLGLGSWVFSHVRLV